MEKGHDLLDQILSDDTLGQQFIDDGGTRGTMKNNILIELNEELKKLEAKRPGLLLKKQSAEAGFNASKAMVSKTQQISIVMDPAERAYTDPMGKRFPGRAPKLATTTVPTVEPPRIAASLAGAARSPEHQAAVAARAEYGENERQIADLKQRIAKVEREVSKLREIYACL